MKDKAIASPYFRGIPTDIDVENLMKELGVPEEGQLIPYSEVEKIIGKPRDSYRFKTVTNAWRKKLERESNAVLITSTNKGFINSTPSQRLDLCSRKAKGGTTIIFVAGERARRNNVSALSGEERRVNDSLVNFYAAVQCASATEAKKLKWPEEADRKRIA